MLTRNERQLLAELRAVILDAKERGDLVGHVRAWLDVAEHRVLPTDTVHLVEPKPFGRCRDCAHYRPEADDRDRGLCAAHAGAYRVIGAMGCRERFAERDTGTERETVPGLLPQVVTA